MMIKPGEVTAVCKNCGGKAPASSFKLDYKARLMVCPNCFSGKKNSIQKMFEKRESPKREKPPGWDKEDELLEQLTRSKRADPNRPRIERIPGSIFVKMVCSNCNYKFKFHPLNNIPRNCPYCDKENPKVKMRGVL
ncbi:hypothetical protein HN385_01830 [archaeon]|jgi:Zn finger protein HypA/HybF involved in hydrogenase expression|nr:hypothetical protein [archaeon]MBT3451569.1 hypothetical protein [archaeon]MBT6869428.1 hypothetical protein [archaeon]MBT7192591.1 hypothetical protein [archaeon]MBT7380667.1 hypothetical protein [archaeon]